MRSDSISLLQVLLLAFVLLVSFENQKHSLVVLAQEEETEVCNLCLDNGSAMTSPENLVSITGQPDQTCGFYQSLNENGSLSLAQCVALQVFIPDACDCLPQLTLTTDQLIADEVTTVVTSTSPPVSMKTPNPTSLPQQQQQVVISTPAPSPVPVLSTMSPTRRTAAPVPSPTNAPVASLTSSPSRAPPPPSEAPVVPVPPPTAAPETAAPVAIQPTIAPAQPTIAPAQPTIAPVQPTIAPVQPTAAPVNPSAAPVNPTAAPVNPTTAPVALTPVPVNPTRAPVEPTPAPVNQPTAAPMNPTAAPVNPTSSPVAGPVALPALPPPPIPTGTTLAPADPPTRPPVLAPSMAPIVPPTIPPVAPPTRAQTSDPIPSPTRAPALIATPPLPKPPAPTLQPTAGYSEAPLPNQSPTVSPVAVSGPTRAPSVRAPTITNTTTMTTTTSAPTPAPTSSPTPAPTITESLAPTRTSSSSPTTTMLPTILFTLQEGSRTDMQMKLNGIASLTPDEQSTWATTTADYIIDFYENTTEAQAYGVKNFMTKIVVTGVESIRTSDGVITSTSRIAEIDGGRALQDEDDEVSTLLTYNQQVEYQGSNPNFTIDDALATPFLEDSDAGANYLEVLTESSPIFSDITGFESISVDDDSDAEAPTELEEKGLSKSVLIGLGTAGAAALLLICLVCFFFRLDDRHDDYNRQKNMHDNYNDGEDDTKKTPPANIGVSYGADEVSTLGPPLLATAGGVGRAPDPSVMDYGEESVATVDYDYCNAFGGAGAATSVVSSAGGTKGSTSRNFILQQPNSLNPSIASRGPGAYRPTNGQHSHHTNYETVVIFAPPGKLGVVIDTPDDGFPVVFTVKDTSVLWGKLRVGDKLVSIDDEGVTGMSAVMVSKMISRKSKNPTRKLTVVRAMAPGSY